MMIGRAFNLHSICFLVEFNYRLSVLFSVYIHSKGTIETSPKKQNQFHIPDIKLILSTSKIRLIRRFFFSQQNNRIKMVSHTAVKRAAACNKHCG